MQLPPEQRKESSCDCNICRAMCHRCPCMPTPEEAEILISKGYRDKLILSEWREDPKNSDSRHFYISGILTPKGCAFLTPEGLCELHDLKLKPLEGRLAIHDQGDNRLRKWIAGKWETARGMFLLYKWAHQSTKTKK